MKIWKHAGKTHFQLKDLQSEAILIDFSIETEYEDEIINHIMRHLRDYLGIRT